LEPQSLTATFRAQVGQADRRTGKADRRSVKGGHSVKRPESIAEAADRLHKEAASLWVPEASLRGDPVIAAPTGDGGRDQRHA